MAVDVRRRTNVAVAGQLRCHGKRHARFQQGSHERPVGGEDEAVRAITVRALTRAGYRVLVADSGETALDLARAHEGPIHLLVTDVVMQGMSGLALAEALREIRPEVRTLFVSGYTENTIVHHGVLEPGVEFLPKPFTPAALVGRVRGVLGPPS